MIEVGFTGTQLGMTEAQKKTVRYLLELVKEGHGEEIVAHHGDCIGSDAEFDSIARELGFYVVIHPPSNSSKRAYCGAPDETEEGTAWRDAKPYLERNHDIVDETSRLIATPKSAVMEIRSGTWATVRYARSVGKKVFIVEPDGKITGS